MWQILPLIFTLRPASSLLSDSPGLISNQGAPQTMPFSQNLHGRLSKFEQDFLVWLEHKYDTPPLPASIFKQERVKEVFARLDPARIPAHPLDQRGAQAISEALQAWRLCCQLCMGMVRSGRECLNSLVQHLVDAWPWVLFLLPGEGHIRDLPGSEFETAEFPLQSDGTVAVTAYMRYRILLTTYILFLDNPASAPIILSLPRFKEVFMSLLTYDWPRAAADFVNDFVHGLMKLLHSSIVLGRGTRAGMPNSADILEHERHRPGALLRAVFQRSVWFLKTGTMPGEYIRSYSDLVMHLFEDRELGKKMFASFRCSSGITVLVETLLASVPQIRTARDVQKLKDNVNARIVIRCAISTLDFLLMDRDSDRHLAEALEAGLLVVVDRLQTIVPEGSYDDFNWRMSGDGWLNMIFPAMIWPDVLRACGRHHVFEGRPVDEASTTMWPSWKVVARRYAILYPRYKLYRKALQLAGRQGCCNQKCQSALLRPGAKVKTKMCGCATVHYCSSACQRADWLARHRSSCTNVANRARMKYKKLRADEVANEFPRPTYLEFHFIKCIAVDEVTRFLETENPVDEVTFLVGFEERTDGPLHISTYPGLNRGRPGTAHIFARVSWAESMGADIEVASFVSIDKLRASAKDSSRMPGA